MGTGKTIVLVDGEAPPRFIPSTRFTLALMVFFAFIIQYSQRVNLPIAIVCMVNRTKPMENPLIFNGSTITTTTINTHLNMNNDNDPMTIQSTTIKTIIHTIQKTGFLREKQFNWVELQQQILLGGYWAGYIFTQVPGKFLFLFLQSIKTMISI